jgi:hypothetical protein
MFTSHTYRAPNLIDIRLEELDKDQFDLIWLGGDICSESFLEYETLEYLQEQLRIKNPHHFWSLGNHDTRNNNKDWFREFTGKNTYYADNFENITAIVIDTNLDPSDCENLDSQYNTIVNVCDTISSSSHLILLFHWGLWDNIPGIPSPGTYGHSNLKYWNSNCDSTNNNFTKSIYPLLKNVQNRGIQVICIMGDMGSTYRSIDFTSDDDIIFLGCGLYQNNYLVNPDDYDIIERDKLLVFHNNITANTLTWNYQDFDSLIDVQNGLNYIIKDDFNNPEEYPDDDIQIEQYDNYIYRLYPDSTFNISEINIAEILWIGSKPLKISLTAKLESEEGSGELRILCEEYEGEIITNTTTFTINDLTSLEYKFNEFEFTLSSTNTNKVKLSISFSNPRLKVIPPQYIISL